jgi:hypothetical protein
MQKIMIKGLAKDEMSLRKLGVTRGAKVMVVGSTLSDVLEVAKKPTPAQLKEVEEKEAKKESWSQQKQHKKVLEKGVPEDAMPGLKVINTGSVSSWNRSFTRYPVLRIRDVLSRIRPISHSLSRIQTFFLSRIPDPS